MGFAFQEATEFHRAASAIGFDRKSDAPAPGKRVFLNALMDELGSLAHRNDGFNRRVSRVIVQCRTIEIDPETLQLRFVGFRVSNPRGDGEGRRGSFSTRAFDEPMQLIFKFDRLSDGRKFSGTQKATILSLVSSGVGISTNRTDPLPQDPTGSTQVLGRR